MTHEHGSYVSIETAKLLKQAGFDWHTNLVYVDDILLTNPYTADWNNTIPDTYISAPTLDVAQRWFREVKKISVEVKTCCWVNRYQDGKYTISYIYEIFNIDTSILPIKEDKFIRYAIDCAHNIEFQTYEEALDEGLQTCLTLLLNNKE